MRQEPQLPGSCRGGSPPSSSPLSRGSSGRMKVTEEPSGAESANAAATSCGSTDCVCGYQLSVGPGMWHAHGPRLSRKPRRGPWCYRASSRWATGTGSGAVGGGLGLNGVARGQGRSWLKAVLPPTCVPGALGLHVTLETLQCPRMRSCALRPRRLALTCTSVAEYPAMMTRLGGAL